MTRGVTMETGEEALAGLLDELRRADDQGLTPQQAAVRLWPSVRNVIAAALTEMREEELEGLERFRATRHEKG